MNQYVDWCLRKAKEALINYDQPTALDYLALARVWNKKEK